MTKVNVFTEPIVLSIRAVSLAFRVGEELISRSRRESLPRLERAAMRKLDKELHSEMSETVAGDKNLHEVQERLMKMLDSVRLDPNAPVIDRPAPREKVPARESETASRPVPSENSCPKCHSEESWGNSSWCPACGYHPQLKLKVFSEDMLGEEEEEAEDLTFLDLVRSVPAWVFCLGGGFVLILMQSLAVRGLISSLEQRSPLAILQAYLGLLVFVPAHLRAYYLACQVDEDINFLSIFWSPVVVWKRALTLMPNVSRTLCSGAWGGTIFVAAFLIVGVDYVSILNPENREARKSLNPMKTIIQVASKTASVAPPSTVKANGSIEDAWKDFAGDVVDDVQNSGSDPIVEPDQEETPIINTDKKPPEELIVWSNESVTEKKEFENEYIIFGYLTNSAGEIRSLLLAQVIQNGTVKFVGKYPVQSSDKSFVVQLQKKLESYRSRYPVMETPYIAKWTTPQIRCKIAHNGVTPDGRFEEGQMLNFKERYQPPKK